MQNGDFLKNKFEHFNADVPPEVWDNVASALDNKKKRRVVIWWFSGVAAVMILGFSLVHFRNGEKTIVQKEAQAATWGSFKMTAVNQKQTNNANNNFNTGQSATDSKRMNKTLAEQKGNAIKRNRQSTTPKYIDEPLQEITELTVEEELVQIHEPVKIPEPQNTDSVTPKEKTHDEPKEDLVTSNPANQITKENELKSKKWELALIGGFSATRRQNSSAFLAGGLTNSVNLEYTGNNADYLNISESNSNSISSVIRFTLINVGISINRALAPRLRLESGLHYLRYGVFYENSQSWSRGAQMIQAPVMAHFSLIQSNIVDWRIGSGIGMTYVFRQASPVFRSEWVNNTTIMFKFHQSWSLFIQPEARMVFYDSRISQVGKLSQWYWGVNLGVVKRF